ncbi:Gtr1/RagA G protein conserved region-domain-containing protein [Syncephalis fuscata]|nr:Gtr1/RagA G protein conserved region-domain-containing protein [Syncephalis fuscata]
MANTDGVGGISPAVAQSISQAGDQVNTPDYGVGGVQKPRLLLMGLRRSGKSSIQKVVFHKMAPNDTLYLDSTRKLIKDDVVSFIEFQVWDFPNDFDLFDPTFDAFAVFGQIGTLVYVIDAQDDYTDSLSKLHMIIVRAFDCNQNISFEVFIHKVDGLSDDFKFDIQRDIQRRLMDELADEGLEDVQINFYLTSIYDRSIYEACSKVVQKLIPQLPTLENLLDMLCSNSGIEKAFLFDIESKLYLATDSSPVDMQSYEICSEMIDIILDLSIIYGETPSITPNDHGNSPSNAMAPTTPTNKLSSTEDNAHSVIKLSSGITLFFRQIDRHLALICLMRTENYENHGLLDHNVRCFKDAITEVFEMQRSNFQQDVTDTTISSSS